MNYLENIGQEQILYAGGLYPHSSTMYNLFTSVAFLPQQNMWLKYYLLPTWISLFFLTSSHLYQELIVAQVITYEGPSRMDGVVGIYLATNMRGIRWCLSINLIKTISLLALTFSYPSIFINPLFVKVYINNTYILSVQCFILFKELFRISELKGILKVTIQSSYLSDFQILSTAYAEGHTLPSRVASSTSLIWSRALLPGKPGSLESKCLLTECPQRSLVLRFRS